MFVHIFLKMLILVSFIGCLECYISHIIGQTSGLHGTTSNPHLSTPSELYSGKQLNRREQLKRDRPPLRKAGTDANAVRIKKPRKTRPSIPRANKHSAVICRDFQLDSQKTFTFIGSFKELSQLSHYNIPEIAFVGRSNVGKSSLLNALTGLNKNIAIESKTPGRTRAINMFHCKDNDGDICNFVDLPGYGYAKMSREEQIQLSFLIRDYLLNRNGLRLVVMLIDSRLSPSKLDIEMFHFLTDAQIPFVMIATKIDKLKENELRKAIPMFKRFYELPVNQPIPFSAVEKKGEKDVWKVIRDGILDQLPTPEEEILAATAADVISAGVPVLK